MAQDIILKIIMTIIGIITTGVCGYLVAKAKVYKEKIKNKEKNEEIQNIAIKQILKSQLTKTYYVYSELKTMPDYVYQDFLDMLQVYESFNGDGYIHNLAKKMETWELTKTDIL